MGNDWSIYARLTWDLVEYGDFDRFELEGFGTVAIDDEDDSGVEFDNHFGARML